MACAKGLKQRKIGMKLVKITHHKNSNQLHRTEMSLTTYQALEAAFIIYLASPNRNHIGRVASLS
jgi:hypothetical protein